MQTQTTQEKRQKFRTESKAYIASLTDKYERRCAFLDQQGVSVQNWLSQRAHYIDKIKRRPTWTAMLIGLIPALLLWLGLVYAYPPQGSEWLGALVMLAGFFIIPFVAVMSFLDTRVHAYSLKLAIKTTEEFGFDLSEIQREYLGAGVYLRDAYLPDAYQGITHAPTAHAVRELLVLFRVHCHDNLEREVFQAGDTLFHIVNQATQFELLNNQEREGLVAQIADLKSVLILQGDARLMTQMLS